MNTTTTRRACHAACMVQRQDFVSDNPRAHRAGFGVLSASTCILLSVWSMGTAPLAGAIVVRTDQSVYNVLPGQTFPIQVHIDFNDQTLGNAFEPLPNGLFSYGFSLSYPPAMATVPTAGDIAPVPALDFFGFNPGAMRQVTASSAMIKGNIDQTFNIPYAGSLLATIQVTNLAPASTTYFVQLDEWRTLGPAEQIFIDGAGIVLDTVPSTDLFLPAQINVIPEPAIGGRLGIGVLAWSLQVIRRVLNVRAPHSSPRRLWRNGTLVE